MLRYESISSFESSKSLFESASSNGVIHSHASLLAEPLALPKPENDTQVMPLPLPSPALPSSGSSGNGVDDVVVGAGVVVLLDKEVETAVVVLRDEEETAMELEPAYNAGAGVVPFGVLPAIDVLPTVISSGVVVEVMEVMGACVEEVLLDKVCENSAVVLKEGDDTAKGLELTDIVGAGVVVLEVLPTIAVSNVYMGDVK